jgi:hypothetical protein
MLKEQLDADYEGTMQRTGDIAAALQPTTRFQARCMVALLDAILPVLPDEALPSILLFALRGLT